MSKENLIDKAYSTKEWDSSFTSSFNADNKKIDHEGSYQSDETSLNIISLNRNDTAENNSGLSASKLRQMVKNTIERQHDISFKKMLFKQSFIDEDTSNEIFNKIREKYSKKNSKKSRRNSPSNVGHSRSRLRRNTVK